jgi:hypothetical protein
MQKLAEDIVDKRCEQCGKAIPPDTELCEECAAQKAATEAQSMGAEGPAPALEVTAGLLDPARVEKLAMAMDYLAANPHTVDWADVIKRSSDMGAPMTDENSPPPPASTIELGSSKEHPTLDNPLKPGGEPGELRTDENVVPEMAPKTAAINPHITDVLSTIRGAAIPTGVGAGTLLGTGVGAATGALAAGEDQRGAGALRGALIGAGTGAVGGGLQGLALRRGAGHAIEGLETISDPALLARLGQEKLPSNAFRDLMKDPDMATAIMGSGIDGRIGKAGVALSAAGALAGAPLLASQLRGVPEEMEVTASALVRRIMKKAEATLNPEDRPPQERPAEVTQQEALIAPVDGALNLTPEQAAAVPKKQMGDLLDEPMQSAQTDPVIQQAFSPEMVADAGAKVASSALISKLAAELCSCGGAGTCGPCKIKTAAMKSTAAQAMRQSGGRR